jgi:phosphopantothenoylcysteine synthetase/decarboxylase
MQIARIISTLNVRRQRERHRGGVTITGRRIQRVLCAFSNDDDYDDDDDDDDDEEEEEEQTVQPVVIRH